MNTHQARPDAAAATLGPMATGAAIRLKALTAEEAWVVAAILEDLLDAVWRVPWRRPWPTTRAQLS